MVQEHFVADGQQRAAAASQVQIRTHVQRAVQAKYAKQLEEAGFFRRIWLRMKISAEINKQVAAELEKIAPSEALYAAGKRR